VNILFCGDVVGRAGREVVCDQLPELREKLALDLVVVNAENAAGGYGVTAEICAALYQAGADVVTLGNHAWDQREVISYIESDAKLLRPYNYPAGTPGRGGAVFRVRDGRSVFVFQVMTRLFMDPLDDPFASARDALASHRLGHSVDAIVLDIHGEATSEKQALAHYVDGRVSLAAGTHTHVPTADAQVLPKGTAFITDIGMCGAYDSVIGMEIGTAIEKFTRKLPTPRLKPVLGDATLCAVYLETDDDTGLARRVAPLRLGGPIAPSWPI
jgi:metallophosphoesterase (TIGR00282 family)